MGICIPRRGMASLVCDRNAFSLLFPPLSLLWSLSLSLSVFLSPLLYFHSNHLRKYDLGGKLHSQHWHQPLLCNFLHRTQIFLLFIIFFCLFFWVHVTLSFLLPAQGKLTFGETRCDASSSSSLILRKTVFFNTPAS